MIVVEFETLPNERMWPEEARSWANQTEERIKNGTMDNVMMRAGREGGLSKEDYEEIQEAIDGVRELADELGGVGHD